MRRKARYRNGPRGGPERCRCRGIGTEFPQWELPGAARPRIAIGQPFAIVQAFRQAGKFPTEQGTKVRAGKDRPSFSPGPISGLQDSGLELLHVRIKRSGIKRPDQDLTGLGGIEDRVHPEPGRGVTRVGLALVRRADGLVKFLFLLLAQLLAFALELLDLDFDERPRRGVAAHDRVARGGPGKNEARVIGLAAHRVVARAETPAEDHADFGHHAVRHRIHHLGARADDAAPFRLFADHKPIDVVQKNKRHQVLVAVEDEARGFRRRFRVDYAAELDALLARTASHCRDDALHVFLLVGDDADGPAADARVPAEHRLAVFGAVLLKHRAVHDPGNDLPHIVLLRWVGREDSVDVLGRIERLYPPEDIYGI